MPDQWDGETSLRLQHPAVLQPQDGGLVPSQSSTYTYILQNWLLLQQTACKRFYSKLEAATPRRGKTSGSLEQSFFCSAEQRFINSQRHLQSITINLLENVFSHNNYSDKLNTDKDKLINLAEWKNAPIMSNITVDTGRQQLLLLLSTSRALSTVQT